MYDIYTQKEEHKLNYFWHVVTSDLRACVCTQRMGINQTLISDDSHDDVVIHNKKQKIGEDAKKKIMKKIDGMPVGAHTIIGSVAYIFAALKMIHTVCNVHNNGLEIVI